MMIRRIVHTLSVRSSIAASGKKLLREISGSPDVTFITGHGNIGDHLIHAGARQLLSGTSYKETRIFRDRKGGIQGLEGLGGHTALITGSGGWCEPFHGLLPEALQIILLEAEYGKSCPRWRALKALAAWSRPGLPYFCRSKLTDDA